MKLLNPRLKDVAPTEFNYIIIKHLIMILEENKLKCGVLLTLEEVKDGAEIRSMRTPIDASIIPTLYEMLVSLSDLKNWLSIYLSESN